MNLQLTRQLAQLASFVHLLASQRDALTELGDIKEIRNLEESFSATLREAHQRGLVPRDPLSVLRADWLRLAAWSNRVQEALKQADALCRRVSLATAGGMHQKATADSLRRLEAELEEAPAKLHCAMEQGREEIQESDWEGVIEDLRSRICFLLRVRAGGGAARTRTEVSPYAELIQVAETMGWGEGLAMCEFAADWVRDLKHAARSLVASRFAVEEGSSFLMLQINVLKNGLERVRSLLQIHRHHLATLGESAAYLSNGSFRAAETAIQSLDRKFSDIPYRESLQTVFDTEKAFLAELDRFLAVQVPALLAMKDVAEASFFNRSKRREKLKESLRTLAESEEILRKRMQAASRTGAIYEVLKVQLDSTQAIQKAAVELDVSKFRVSEALEKINKERQLLAERVAQLPSPRGVVVDEGGKVWV